MLILCTYVVMADSIVINELLKLRGIFVGEVLQLCTFYLSAQVTVCVQCILKRLLVTPHL